MDMEMIKHVCEIFNKIDDPEKAYDEAVKYLNIIRNMETAPCHQQTIALIEKYLEKGSDPSIEEFFKNICKKIEKKD